MNFKELTVTIEVTDQMGNPRTDKVNLLQVASKINPASLMKLLTTRYPGQHVKIIDIHWQLDTLDN